MSHERRVHHLLPLSCLVALAVVFFWSLLTPDQQQRLYLVPGDFTYQFYPYRFFAAAEWWSGRIPLWNPYMFGGHPFQADVQTAVFYPLSLIFDLLAAREGLSFEALELQGVVDYLLAAVFSYLFFWAAVRDRMAAFFSAVVFVFGGYLTSYPFQQMAVLETSIWLPLILLFVELAARSARTFSRWFLLAGLAMAVALLAGHPQAGLFTGYTAGAYLLFRSRCFGRSWRQTVAGGAAFISVALGVAAVQLLPTLEFVALSTRAEMTYEIASGGYDYVALLGLLMPGWRGEKALYLGVAPLILALSALWRPPRREVWFWAAVCFVALALSFGDRGFLYRAFYSLAPGFGLFKGQERAAFIFSFAGAALAGYGLASVRAGALRVGSKFLASLVSVLGVGALGGIFTLWSANDVVSGEPDLARAGYPQLLGLLFAVGMLLWPLIKRCPITGRWAAMAALGLVVVGSADVLVANWHNNMSAVPPPLSDGQQAAGKLLRQRQEMEGEPLRVRPRNNDALPSNYGVVFGIPFAAGDSPIVLRRTQDLFASTEEWRLWQLFNVKYVVGNGQIDGALEEVAGAPLEVYRNRFSLPRAWVVQDLRRAETAEQAKGMVLSTAFDPGVTAIVETELDLSVQPAEPAETLQQKIEFEIYSPQYVRLRAATNRPGLLVVSETDYPGWQARLNGIRVPIERANYALRGIVLPPGEHSVEMEYRPASFSIGLAISVMTVLVSVGACWPLGRGRARWRR